MTPELMEFALSAVYSLTHQNTRTQTPTANQVEAALQLINAASKLWLLGFLIFFFHDIIERQPSGATTDYVDQNWPAFSLLLPQFISQ